MRILAISALLLSACGSLSNDDLDKQVTNEDLQFKYALPSPADVALNVPDPTSKPSGLSASSGLDAGLCINSVATDLFCKGEVQVLALNTFTGAVLAIVDAVRAQHPTKREQNHRVWGPHKDDQHPLRSWMVDVTRAREHGALTYRWTIQVRPLPAAEFVTIIKGSFVPGPGGSASGVGEFTVDGRAQRTIGDTSDLDVLAVRYDLLSETRTVVTDATLPDGSVATFTNDSETSGSGGWTYEVPFPIDAGTTADLTVRLRWNSQHAGRGDAKLTVPNGPNTGSVFVRECWGEARNVLYWEQPAFIQCPKDGCVFGNENLCVFNDLFSNG